MSGAQGIFDLLAAARRYRAGGTGPKATLLALMERMGETGGVWSCFPSMATLAADTEQTPRTVRRHVAGFEAAGLIHREARGSEDGGRNSNRFVLNIEALRGRKADIMSGGVSGHPEQVSGHSEHAAPYKEHPEELPVPTRAEVPVRSGASKPPTTGVRIPDQFFVSPQMAEWAQAEVPAVNVRTETAKFCDYWRAKPGAAARKVDWPATWRVWMRNAAEGAARANGFQRESVGDRTVRTLQDRQARRGTSNGFQPPAKELGR